MEEFEIKCPSCGSKVAINDALDKQLKEKFSKEMKINLDKERARIEQNAIKAAEENHQKEKEFLSQQVKEQTTKLNDIKNKELELRRSKYQLEEEKKDLELNLQRQIDLERKKIHEEVKRKENEESKWKLAERDKIISDLKTQMEEMRRKADQGSQQTQGEVLEIELEEMLRRTFISDNIEPVSKGVNGADIIQEIRDKFQKPSGRIIWELKNTKNWSPGWITKLKDDCRKSKANIAVLVTSVLPDKIKTFGIYDGVWVTKLEFCIGLATALRHSIIDIASTKNSMINKKDKMEIIYQYLTGSEFKQRVEAIAEAFKSMQEDLIKEKRVYEKIWAKREKQLNQVVVNTVGMYGDLEGLMGPALPGIKLLEIEECDDEDGRDEPKRIGESETLF